MISLNHRASRVVTLNEPFPGDSDDVTTDKAYLTTLLGGDYLSVSRAPWCSAHWEDIRARSTSCPWCSAYLEDIRARSTSCPWCSEHSEDIRARSTSYPWCSAHWEDIGARSTSYPWCSAHWEDIGATHIENTRWYPGCFMVTTRLS